MLQFLRKRYNIPCGVVGRDIPVPIPLDMDEPETVGIDRICAAAAAYTRTRAACVVVDFGTAATVNAVADNGVFIGGAILPGLGLAARSLNEHTAALPLVDMAGPVLPLGRDTQQAIRTGIVTGLRGAVRELVESMAESFGKWPKLLFTGGDSAQMGEVCDFVDAVVPDLGLLGVDLADRLYLLQTDSHDD
jgi:type III pantothenate kinase